MSAPAPPTNPWLIAGVVAIATFMEVLDTTIANVALPYISGTMAVSADESAWVVTTYLVANAVILSASTFLAQRFGRKSFYLACVALFTVSSILCGFAWDLRSLLFFRVLQGLGGGGMVPISQSILADAFPPEKRGQGFAMFGVAVVVAPVVGPTLGGWISDNWSWHWCFLINGPVGLLSLALVYRIYQDAPAAIAARKELLASGLRFDLVGFLLMSTFLGSLEVALDRGQQEDWFASPFIIGFTTVCVGAFVALIPYELSRAHPVIDIRMMASRQFASCFLVMMATGAILISTTQIMPQMLQLEFGYSATSAGLVLSPGGVVTMMMMFVVGRLTSIVQPRYLIALGAALTAYAMHVLTSTYADLDFWFFASSRIIIGVGLPLIFIPIITASYDGVPPTKTDQASALMNVARNVGGSIGVSLAQNVLAWRGQFHLSRLVEHVAPTEPGYQEAYRRALDYFAQHGGLASAPARAFGWVARQTARQATLLAYIDVFFVLMLLAAFTVPLALVLRRVKLGGGAPAAH